MANDLNRCEFIGRVGKDIELKYLPTGKAVANFSIAVGEQWKDNQTGAKQERTTWVRIVAFGNLAEICATYLSKGSKVFIAGKFTERKWQDQSGQDRYTTEIVADNLQMLDSKSSKHDDSGSTQQNPSYSAPFDDDIPF